MADDHEFIDQPHETVPRRRLKAVKALFIGLSLLLAIWLPAIALVIYVFVMHAFRFEGGSIFTSAPVGTTMAIAGFLSFNIGATTSLPLGLYGYCVARSWLLQSQGYHVAGGPSKRPTPRQYAHLTCHQLWWVFPDGPIPHLTDLAPLSAFSAEPTSRRLAAALPTSFVLVRPTNVKTFTVPLPFIEHVSFCFWLCCSIMALKRLKRGSVLKPMLCRSNLLRITVKHGRY